MSPNPHSTPLTRRRWRRFLRNRRAFAALCALSALYLLSLGSELLCNDRPLVMRFKGELYFPVLTFHPDDRFTGSGLLTRPDYKAIHASPAFRSDPRNFMVFPPVPFGPNEIIDPQSIAFARRVDVTLRPVQRVGSVDIDRSGTILGGESCGTFFATNDTAVTGLALARHWELPAALSAAMVARFENRESPALSVTVASVAAPGLRAEVSLSTFSPRRRPPSYVRLTFREADSAEKPVTFSFPEGARIPESQRPFWSALPASGREALAAGVAAAMETIVPPKDLTIAGKPWQATFRRMDITWPHAPVRGHWLGIDSAGRDVLARIVYGFRISVTFGLLLVIASMLIGVAAGALQGYAGGWVDITFQRLIEIWSALPFLYVMILLGSVLGRSFTLLLVCYGLFNWIGISYYARAEFLRLRNLPFVEAARCMGVPARRIIFRHILPNALTPMIALLPFSLVTAVMSLAALDFLGFGVPPPTPSWGQMLLEAQQFRWAWWLIVYPSLSLFVVILLGVFIGEGLRDAMDPRPYSRLR